MSVLLWGGGLFFSLFSYEFLSHDWEVLLTGVLRKLMTLVF